MTAFCFKPDMNTVDPKIAEVVQSVLDDIEEFGEVVMDKEEIGAYSMALIHCVIREVQDAYRKVNAELDDELELIRDEIVLR